MKLEAARLFAQCILDACLVAEMEGRDELIKLDTSVFSDLDDDARQELAEAINELKA